MRNPNHRLMVDTSPNQSHQQIDLCGMSDLLRWNHVRLFCYCQVRTCSRITCADCVSRFKDAGSGSTTMTETSKNIYFPCFSCRSRTILKKPPVELLRFFVQLSVEWRVIIRSRCIAVDTQQNFKFDEVVRMVNAEAQSLSLLPTGASNMEMSISCNMIMQRAHLTF